MMDQSVHHGHQKPFIRGDPILLCQRKISSQDNVAPFVAVGDDVEEQARAGYVSGEVSPLINNQQIKPLKFGLQLFHFTAFMRRGQFLYKVRHASEINLLASVACFNP